MGMGPFWPPKKKKTLASSKVAHTSSSKASIKNRTRCFTLEIVIFLMCHIWYLTKDNCQLIEYPNVEKESIKDEGWHVKT